MRKSFVGLVCAAVAGSLVILLMLFFMFFYDALPSALVLTMIGIGAMVRERRAPAASVQ